MIRRMGGGRNYEIPVLGNGDTMVVENVEKAELLALMFRKVHCSENLSEGARQCRIRTIMKNPRIVESAAMSGDPLDLHFNMSELKKAIVSARQTTPGKDDVCYTMLELTIHSVTIVQQGLGFCQIPSVWKQAIIVPVPKPGKDPSDPSSYRPIASTSHLCKITERIVTERLTYFLESKAILSPCQSGFRKGRSTIDSVLCLESDIRKAQTNKEVVVDVFFDVEKAALEGRTTY